MQAILFLAEMFCRYQREKMYKSMDKDFLNSLALLNQESEGTLLTAMLRTYCAVWPDYVQRLRQSFHNQDAKALSTHAASFRTLVGSFGASSLMYSLTQIEQSALRRDWDAANAYMQEMKKELCQFQEDIEQMRQQYPSHAKAS
jgi:HPt (histidine-containing phosphotransfer) domain-containing protein